MPPEPQAGSRIAPVVRLDDLDDQLHDALGRVEHPTLLALPHRKLAEEVLVDLAEGVAGQIDGCQEAYQLHKDIIAEVSVGLRQSTREVWVILLDGLHGLVDGLPDIVSFSEGLKMTEASLRAEEDDTLGLVVGLGDLETGARANRAYPGFNFGEALLGIAEEDQAEHRRGELGRLQARIGPELVCCGP